MPANGLASQPPASAPSFRAHAGQRCAPAAADAGRSAVRMDAWGIVAAIALPLVTAGCSEYLMRLHQQAALVENEGRLTIGDGTNVVLEYEKAFFLLPGPHASSREGLYVELEASHLVEGSVLAVPSDTVRCVPWRRNGSLKKTAEDCLGTIAIDSVSPAQVRARVDVRSDTLDLTCRQRVKFRRAQEAALNDAE